MNVLWARPRTSFSVAPEGSDAEALVPAKSLSPPLGRGQELGVAGHAYGAHSNGPGVARIGAVTCE